MLFLSCEENPKIDWREEHIIIDCIQPSDTKTMPHGALVVPPVPTQHTFLEGSCAPVLYPDAGPIALGAFLALGTLLIPIPQVLKVLREKSSAGLSVPTLLLTILFGCAGLGSTVAVKWSTFDSCKSDGPVCLTNLLDLLQQIASAVSWLVTLACVLAYPPARTPRNAATVVALLVTVSGIVGVSIGLAAAQPCSAASLGLAEALGWLGAACAVVQFAPQLHSTCIKVCVQICRFI